MLCDSEDIVHLVFSGMWGASLRFCSTGASSSQLPSPSGPVDPDSLPNGIGHPFLFLCLTLPCDALCILPWEFTCCTKHQHHLGALMQSPHWAQRLKHFTWGRHGHSKERKRSHSDAPQESRGSAVVCKHNCDLYYLQTGSP